MKKTLILILSICMAVSVCLAAAPAVFAEEATGVGPYDLFVSPSGDDAADGSQARPLRTPAGAQRRLQALKGRVPAGSRVTVRFAEGRYELAETLRFTGADLPDVTFRAEKGARVEFSGARAISGFTEGEANGVRVFIKRLDPAASGGYFKSLFNGETQLSVPRYPAEGYLTVRKTAPEDDLWTEENTPWSFTLGQRSFYADPADIGVPFTNPDDVSVRILHYWHDELMMLTGYDAASGKISLSRPSSMLIRDIDRYYFENVFEALDAPGEWYLDRAAGVLYYVPQAGERADALTLYASSLECLLEIDGVSGLEFRGIRFTQTDWNVPAPGGDFGDWRAENDIDALQAALDVRGVVTVRHAERIAFDGCEFTNLGADGVKLMNGVRDSRVENCYFENIAATAVFVGGANCQPGEAEYTSDIRVVNNEIFRYGRRFFCAIGVHITYCDTAEIRNNEIHDGYYTGISCGWIWGYTYHVTKNISICDNLIYDIGQGWLSDMGGIYMLGMQPGTVLSGNVIHNVAADPGEGGYGGWGIYLDEGSSLMTVEKNLVFCCGSQGLNIHYGEGNVIRNNISALSAEGQASTGSRNEPHATAFYYNNIFVTDKNVPVYIYMQNTSHFYENGNLFWNLSDPGALTFSKNGGGDLISLRQAKKEGFIHNETVADPLFRDIGRFDFTLAEDSPAFALNFRRWDYDAAGTLPGTTLGLGREGGKTAYNAGVRLNEYGSFRRGSTAVVLPAAVGLFSAALLAAFGAALFHTPKKFALPTAALLLGGVSAVAAYRFFVDWSPVGYALSFIALMAAASLLLFAALRRPAPGAKAALRYLICFAAETAVFFGLTLLLNNVLRIGEALAVSCVLLAVAAVSLAATLRLLFRRADADEKKTAPGA